MSAMSGSQHRPASTTAGLPQRKSTSHQHAPRNARVTPEDIRACAYEIYRERCGNGAAGDALSDWLRAERELNSQVEAGSRGELLMKGDQE